ncbi:arabinogalactan oligomer / maltooligosaccharide transport system permease protein [Pseudobutyrivibrio sp. YE44]|uniref:carbohydrate ABC transporter permease n=1 Tax=Pseudobutyrivibrio sp. YE44 TaxID=1520802 RepID=UPI00088F664A|nr:sugar ABC transporter permease [Pseudobutyrivibrio sp. YE44]SDB29435.1 arabinogalactan oligomer / maltooligosaccharide transport system permease protein [Pseudobutyrivibrio sp. YE44]
MKNLLNKLGSSLKAFGHSVVSGDIWVKLSLIIMGAGYFGRKQIMRGILMTLLEVGVISSIVGVFMPYMSKLNTLGTVQREEIFDIVTMKKTVNDYDNSLLILLYGIIGILVILAFIALYIANVNAVYRIQKMAEEGEHINSFKDDIASFKNERFHITLLTLPSLGVILINVIPILFMVCIAFTNYDENHQPPTYLFTWVGIKNFVNLFTTSQTITFGYAFVRVLAWTLIWAVLATATTFLGGILLAQFINHEDTHLKGMWRTLFVITIGIPQFVTLLLISKMFGDNGIVNTMCANVGILDFFKHIGLLSPGDACIPFLSRPGWVHVSIILVNIWIGIPYQMLVATGILMNIPSDQIESAKIDGANKFQIFWKITMPYVMFITGPSLIQSVIANINNFNVIYLLTNNYATGNMYMANSHAKECDLLITWLFTLTNEYSNFKMASVIGIVTFVICAALSLLTFSRMIGGDKEGVYR